MSWLDGLSHRIRTLLRAGDYERELREEMGFHESLDAMQQRDRDRARRRFGNRTWYQEETRRMTWLGSLDVLRQDATYAWRSIVRRPGFTITVVVTLALGIGLNAAMFSFLDRILFRTPPGVEDPATLRRIWMSTSGRADGPYAREHMAYPVYSAMLEAAGSSADIALFTADNAMSLGRDRSGPPVHGVFATSNYFRVLGVRPALGRFYTADEDLLGAGSNVVVLSYSFWRSRFRADSAILNQLITLGPQRYTVIGVAQPQFVGLDVQAADVWIPLGAIPTTARERRWWETFNSFGARTVLRAKPAFSDAAFGARATPLALAAESRLPYWGEDSTMVMSTGSIIEARGPGRLDQDIVIATRLAIVAILVLLIACANVVNLLLARAVHRRREIAVRLALGVSRSRLVRLLTTETLLLALAAGAAATLTAQWGGELLRALLLPNIEWIDSPLDLRVGVFTIAAAVATGLVAGIIPAIQASNPGLTAALKAGAREAGKPGTPLRSALVVVQAAFSVVLLVGAALFVRSLQNVRGLDVGFDTEQVVVATPQFYEGEEQPDSVVARGIARIAQRLEGRSGVESVARSNSGPMDGYNVTDYFTGSDSVGSRGEKGPVVHGVSSTYFRTVGLRFLRGATFTSDGAAAPREVVVNQEMADLFWPGAEALGRCIRMGKRDNPCNTVVGVVETARRMRVIEDVGAAFYLPLGLKSGWEGTHLVARAQSGSEAAVAAELRSALRREYPNAHPSVTVMADQLAWQYRPWRMSAALFSAFGVLALIVAVVGIYSTVAYGVNQRTHEFGVRVALGAQVPDVLRLVLGQGLRVVAIGVIIGVVLALAGGRFVTSMLYGVEPGDLRVIVFTSAALLVAAAIATLIPAWRAARVDPVTALRSE